MFQFLLLIGRGGISWNTHQEGDLIRFNLFLFCLNEISLIPPDLIKRMRPNNSLNLQSCPGLITSKVTS